MNQSMLLRIRESDTQIREPDTERMVPRFVLMIALLENKHRVYASACKNHRR